MQAIFFDLYEKLVTHFDPHWKPTRQSIAEYVGISYITLFEPNIERFAPVVARLAET